MPDIPLPDPIEFKAGVLRSKGRIASGLLHAKAGILRAGANILSQKANALDKVAQAIPAVKAGLINTLKGFGGDKGGGGGYGAPQQQGYGAPQQQSYNAPQQQSYNAPSNGYGTPQGPINGGPTLQNYGNQGVNNIPSTNFNVQPQNNFQNVNVGSSLNFANNQAQQRPQQQQYGNNQNQFSNNRPVFSNNNQLFTNNNQQQTVFNNAAQSAPDSYGSPVGNPIGPSTTSNNNNQLFFSNNNNNQAQQAVGGYSVSNNNQFSANNNVQNQQQAIGSYSNGNNNNQFNPINPVNTVTVATNNQLLQNTNLVPNANVDSNPAALTFVNNDIASQANPFLSTPEKLLLQESRQQQVNLPYYTSNNSLDDYLLVTFFLRLLLEGDDYQRF